MAANFSTLAQSMRLNILASQTREGIATGDLLTAKSFDTEKLVRLNCRKLPSKFTIPHWYNSDPKLSNTIP